MAISIDWGNRIINVPRADMVLIQSVPTEIRQLNLDTFRLELKSLEYSDFGMSYPDTHRHNTTVTVGGATLARVIEIINGYTVTFEDGQYAVNLVGANSNVGDVVNVNQVSVRSSNSAGLQDLNSLQAASFDGHIAVDVNSTYSGTEFPVGTRDKPVNNIYDAILIAESRNLRRLQILSSMTISGGDLTDGYTIEGENAVTVQVTIDDAAQVQGCQFASMTLTGVLDGQNVFRDSLLLDCTFVNGFIHQCAIQGTIVLGGNSQASLLDCYSNVAGVGAGQWVNVDMGGSGNSLAVRNYSGGLNIQNYAGGGAVSIDMSSGRVTFESSVTGGEIGVRGVADVVDNSGPGATIYDLTVNGAIDDVPTQVWGYER